MSSQFELVSAQVAERVRAVDPAWKWALGAFVAVRVAPASA